MMIFLDCNRIFQKMIDREKENVVDRLSNKTQLSRIPLKERSCSFWTDP